MGHEQCEMLHTQLNLLGRQRSGIEVKEKFLDKGGNKDGADHRCLIQDQNPMTLDV